MIAVSNTTSLIALVKIERPDILHDFFEESYTLQFLSSRFPRSLPTLAPPSSSARSCPGATA